MEMVTPRIEILEDGATYGKFVVEPLEQGFGVKSQVHRVVFRGFLEITVDHPDGHPSAMVQLVRFQRKGLDAFDGHDD